MFVGQAVFRAWLKFALNRWYGRFYDAVGGGAATAGDDGGEGSPTAATALGAQRAEVWRLLCEFAWTVAPSVVVNPAAGWLTSLWRFAWRVTLVRAYLCHYDTSRPPIEGMAQRVHEDARRFEDGVAKCVSVGLDALLTLAVFTPVLLAVGNEVHLPGWHWPPWLLTLAIGCAMSGLAVSVLVGRNLVELEVANQRVEARLRTALVVLERTRWHDDTDVNTSVGKAFEPIVNDLTRNYSRLYANFAMFNTWISTFDQVMILLPYLLVAPLLFAEDPMDRVQLGALMRVTNAFQHVFDALSILTENWASVNDFRSTVRRLSEFEVHIFQSRDRSDVELVANDAAVDLPAGRVAELDEDSASHGIDEYSKSTQSQFDKN